MHLLCILRCILGCKLDFVDRNTGEVVETETSFNDFSHLRDKYALQDIAAAILPATFPHKSAPKGIAKNRVRNCLRSVRSIGASTNSSVGVFKHMETGNCSYKDLQLCGSIWSCNLCAAKVSERRAAFIQNVSEQHLAAGGGIVLLTLTFSHDRFDDPKFLADNLVSAWSAFARDRSVKNTLKNDFGCLGGVRALEVTYGDNHGWHPHLHILLYVDSYIDVPRDLGKEYKFAPNPAFDGSPRDRMEKALFSRWLSYCEKNGLGLPNEKYGVRVDNGDFAARYVSKQGEWNSAKEITKQSLKRGRVDRYTPFELLKVAGWQIDGVGDNELNYPYLFRSYVEAFYRKQQTVWYRLKNLKEHYNFDDLADAKDESLAEMDIDDLYKVGVLNLFQWWRVVQAKERATVLSLFKAVDPDFEPDPVLEKLGIGPKTVNSVYKFIDSLPPSQNEIEILAFEKYSRDGRVKKNFFAADSKGYKDFTSYLARIRGTARFGALVAEFSGTVKTCPNKELWDYGFFLPVVD